MLDEDSAKAVCNEHYGNISFSYTALDHARDQPDETFNLVMFEASKFAQLSGAAYLLANTFPLHINEEVGTMDIHTVLRSERCP